MATASVNVPALGSGVRSQPFSPLSLVRRGVVHLLPSQVNIADVTPINIVPAFGANTLIVPVFWTGQKKAVTNWSSNSTFSAVYTGQAANKNILGNFTLSLGGAPLDVIESSGSMAGGQVSGNLVPPGIASMANKGIDLIANLPNTHVAGDDGSLVIFSLFYVVLSLL